MQNSALRRVSETTPIITDYDSTAVSIIGYTGSQGTKASNQQLSQACAKAVASKPTKTGVNQQRVMTEGRGESQPKT